MERIITIIICFILCCISPLAYAQGLNRNLEQRVNALQREQSNIKSNVANIKANVANNQAKISSLKQENTELYSKVDSLNNVTINLAKSQIANKDSLSKSIVNTNIELSTSKSAIASRTVWGLVIAIIVLIFIVIVAYLIIKKINKGTNSIESTIDNVRKTQESLQRAQTKLQEDSVKLDNKMLDITQKQLVLWHKEDKPKANTKPDHSLVLKVADEIVRIELNMSRMDPNIRGYKQLKKAVERIKDNFKANGYEFVEMLGMPYNEGMKVTANFVIDESLEPGQRIISGIIKPQINYNGKMIQAAQITVNQNI